MIHRPDPFFVSHRTMFAVTRAIDVRYRQGERTVLNRRFCLFSRPVMIDDRVCVNNVRVARTESEVNKVG